MRVTIFDSECNYRVHPIIKLITTFGVMIFLPFLPNNFIVIILILFYILSLIMLFKIRFFRFVHMVWHLLKIFMVLFCILIIITSFINNQLNIVSIISSAKFIELLILGIIFTSITTITDYIILFGFIKPLRGITYAYRAMIQTIEEMIDEISVIRSRPMPLLKIIPSLSEKYLLKSIKRAIVFDENCRLKGSLPMF